MVADALGAGAARVMSPDVGIRIEAVMPVDVRAGLVYAIAAVAWVIAGTWVAPRRQPAVALLLYTAGACLAWFALKDWYVPEGYPRAYQRSRVPLVLPLLGGIVGTAAITMRWRAPPPTAHLKSTDPGQ